MSITDQLRAKAIQMPSDPSEEDVDFEEIFLPEEEKREQPSLKGLKIEEIACIFNARHAPPAVPEEARRKLEFAFDNALHYVNEIFRVTAELQDAEASFLVTLNMHQGLFHGMRLLRQRYGIPQWGTRLPNEDSSNPSALERTGD